MAQGTVLIACCNHVLRGCSVRQLRHRQSDNALLVLSGANDGGTRSLKAIDVDVGVLKEIIQLYDAVPQCIDLGASGQRMIVGTREGGVDLRDGDGVGISWQAHEAAVLGLKFMS